MKRDFSVGEIAERIMRPGEDLSAIVARLKNWTKEGLIKATGSKNPGSGQRRTYNRNALIDALFLSILADSVRMPAVTLRRFFSSAYDRRLLETRPSEPSWIHMAIPADGSDAHFARAHADDLIKLLNISKYEAHIVISVDKFHERLNAGEDE